MELLCIFSCSAVIFPNVTYPAVAHWHSLPVRSPLLLLLLSLACRWITTEDKLALEDPSLFCDACYTMLHLDQRGEKLYPYKAFPFVEIVTPDMLQRTQSEQSDAELEAAAVT